jgi:predicted nucleotidyltransferase
MKRDEAIACLKQHGPELKQLGIKRLFLFGSVARNEAREDSEVDLFFDYQKGRLDLFDLMDIKERASTALAAAPIYPPQWSEQGGVTTRKPLLRTLRCSRCTRLSALATEEPGEEALPRR